MASKSSDRETLTPLLINEKNCKKCKQKVTSSFMKCVECDVIFHKSCFNALSQKTRNQVKLISDNEICCENHPISPLPEDFDYYQKLVMELKKENQSLKTENRKLLDELNRLKAGRGQDDDSIIKTLTDKVNADFTGFLANIESNINNKIHKHLEEMKTDHSNCSTIPITPQNATKYSQAVKKNILVLKPKNEQTSQHTLDSLKNKIRPEEVNIGITQIRKLKNGGVLIGCQNDEDLTILQQRTKAEMETDYEVIKPKYRLPKIKIIDIPCELTEESLRKCISNQNSTLSADVIAQWKLVVMKKMKTKYMAIFQLDPKSFEQVLRMGQIFIQWSSCRVYEYFDVHRCFKCGGFNHSSSKCDLENELCLNCNDTGHSEKECVKPNNCVNCTKANNRYKLHLETNHTRFDLLHCECLKREIEKLRINTMYNIE